MKTDKLCRALFSMQPLPGKLKDNKLQEELRAYAGGIVAVSHYTRKQLVLSSGQVAEYAYFVEEGFARGSYYDEKTGRDITVFLWDELSVAVAADSFFGRQPSAIHIEVMPGSTLLSLSYGQLAALFELFPAAETLARLLTLQYNSFHEKRVHDLLTRSAWERYQGLLQTHPRIEQKVSQDILASYLGITPWSLSRLKKQHR